VIVVDTSALMAIILAEPDAQSCMLCLRDADDVVMSAGTLAECLIVAGRRGKKEEMVQLVEGIPVRIEPVSAAAARRVGDAYARWGKGVHPAGLNFGDCFAYAEAKYQACPLLFVGNDFSKTDIASAVA
jgi:ribonuclease VapC